MSNSVASKEEMIETEEIIVTEEEIEEVIARLKKGGRGRWVKKRGVDKC